MKHVELTKNCADPVGGIFGGERLHGKSMSNTSKPLEFDC